MTDPATASIAYAFSSHSVRKFGLSMMKPISAVRSRSSFSSKVSPCQTSANPFEVLKQLSAQYDGIVLTDIHMPALNGLQLLEKIKAIDRRPASGGADRLWCCGAGGESHASRGL